VAHNVNYDRKALKTAFQRMNSETDVELCNDARRWICTWRLSKHILTHNFNDIQYGLGYLRYRLDLPIDDSLRAHRADIDTIVCAALLEKLIDLAIEYNQIDQHLPIGPQLNELCWSFIPITTWPIGKHRGTLLTDLDNDYYVWALGNLPRLDGNNSEYDADLAESVRIVLSKRLEEM
jgi:DNA polymerase III epsilon subunit-like protein